MGRRFRLTLAAVSTALWLGSLTCGGASAQTAAFTDSLGVSPPPGWFIQAPEPDQIVLLGPDGVSLILLSVQQASLPAFYEQLLQPIRLLQGDLIPLGHPRKEGEQVAGSFLVSGLGPLSHARLAARSVSSGRLVVAYGFTQAGKEAELARTLLSVLEAVRLPALPDRAAAPAPVKGQGGQPASRPTAQWRRNLAPGASSVPARVPDITPGRAKPN